MEGTVFVLFTSFRLITAGFLDKNRLINIICQDKFIVNAVGQVLGEDVPVVRCLQFILLRMWMINGLWYSAGAAAHQYTKDNTVRSFNKEIINDERVVSLVQSINDKLGDNGKIFVRASGTEPLIRVTVSCEKQEDLNRYREQVVGLINVIKEEV